MKTDDINRLYSVYTLQTFSIVVSAVVDDDTWYTIQVWQPVIWEWIREQDKAWWYEHSPDRNYHYGSRQYDVHEKLYALLSLKWT
jgi:hypothetical protein